MKNCTKHFWREKARAPVNVCPFRNRLFCIRSDIHCVDIQRQKTDSLTFFDFYNTFLIKKHLTFHIHTVYIRAYAEQTVTERTDVYRSTRFFAPKTFFRSFKVTNANIETKLEQMCCIHTRLVVCAQEHNDFSGGSP